MYYDTNYPMLKIDIHLYFYGVICWGPLSRLIKAMDEEARAIIGTHFQEIANTVDRRQQGNEPNKYIKHPIKHFYNNIPKSYKFSHFLASAIHRKYDADPTKAASFILAHQVAFIPYGEDDYYVPKAVARIPKQERPLALGSEHPYSSLQITISRQGVPIALSSAKVEALMEALVRFVTSRHATIIYGYVRPSLQDVQVASPPPKSHIPDHKLMGIHWGNVITPKQLGKNPLAMKKAVITGPPTKLKKLSKAMLWFNLPMDIMEYQLSTRLTYDQQVQATLDVLAPYNVIWEGGSRTCYE